MNLTSRGVFVHASYAAVSHSAVRVHPNVFFFLIDRIAESLTLEILHEREFLDFLEILKCLVSCDAQRTWTFVGVLLQFAVKSCLP